MKSFYATCLFLAFTIFSFGQNGTIKGTVYEENGEPAIQAAVIVDASQGLATVTDFDGNYTLSLPAGTHLVLFRYLGKKDAIVEVVLGDGETKTINQTLKDKAEIMNTIVVSASKYEKKLSEETVSMEVLKSDLIESNNITNVEDGMNKVPGVTIIEGQANIRGGAGWSYGAGSRVMILYDDLPLLSADAADTKWSFLPTENIEQVEVIKGAASSLYGSGALNGVINIRTGYATSTPETKVAVWSGLMAGPRDKDDGWWYNTNSQPFFTGMNFVHKRKIKRFDVVLHGQYTNKKDDLQENDGGDVRIGGKFRFRPRKIEGMSLGININAYRSWGSVFFLWDGIDERSRIPMPGTASAYQNNRITIDPFISFYDKKKNKYSLRMRYLNSANRNNTGQGSIPIVYNWDLQYNRYFEKAKFNIVGGIAGYFSTVRSPTGDAASSLTGEHNGSNVAPYVQLEKKLFKDKLNITLGSRFEYFKIKSLTYDTTLTSDLNRPLFRVGANYKAAEATFIRASYGEGFRFPTMAELFVNSNIGGIGLFPNPGLQSERGWYAEVAVKQGFKIKEGFQGYIDAAFFVNRYTDMMEFNFGQFGEFDVVKVLDDISNGRQIDINDLGVGFASQNVGNTRILGLELSGGTQGKIGKVPLNILAGYTFVQPIALNWDNEALVLNNSAGEEIEPGAGALEALTGLSATRTGEGTLTDDGKKTYASTSTSSSNVLKYRNRHTIQVDVSSSIKKWDYGVSVQFRSFMQNVDYFFQSEFLTENTALLSDANGDPSSVEALIGTAAFSGFKEFRERYNGRGTTILDARIAYNFSDRAKVALVGKNLLNLTYDIRPALLGDPMNFALQFNYKFKHDPK